MIKHVIPYFNLPDAFLDSTNNRKQVIIIIIMIIFCTHMAQADESVIK